MINWRIVSSLIVSGCVCFAFATDSQSISYDELLLLLDQDEEIDTATLTIELGESEFDGSDLLELALYESQVNLLLPQPLKLGPIGSAILDRFQFSLPGHIALREFYQHVNEPSAQFHDERSELIRDYMRGTGDGGADNPFRAFTSAQAEMFVSETGHHVLGSMYDATETHEFVLRITQSKEGLESAEVVFDLSPSIERYTKVLNLPPDISRQGRHQRVVAWLARENDNAAQLSLGLAYLRRNQADSAIGWLTRAEQSGNELAHVILANLYLERVNAYGDRVRQLNLARDHLNEAVAAGHTPSMRQLGVLLVRGEYGDEAKDEGVLILEQAVARNDTMAMRLLSSIYVDNQFEGQDFEKAANLLRDASVLGSSEARIEYYRVLMDQTANLTLTQQAVDWLVEEAETNNVSAMVELGNCHALGCLARPNFRKARRWYRRAVEADPENASLVNSVAWTLAVSHIKRLRDPRLAIKLMDDLMENDSEARQIPQYVDTWAAAYAAAGRFKRAVEIQTEALQLAKNSNFISSEDFELMTKHLTLFEKRESVSEEIP